MPVFSCLNFHWVDDLPGLFLQIRRLLRPDGLCLVNLLGGESLHELRASLIAAEQDITGGFSPRCAPMADIRDVGGLLGRAGLALPVADSDRLTVNYPNMFRLMKDLRGMGEQNILLGRLRHPTKRAVFCGRQKFIKINLGWQMDQFRPLLRLSPSLVGHRMKASKNLCVLDRQERGWQARSIVMK